MALSIRRALVVNCSAPHYNLGEAKLANYLARTGYDVTRAAGGEALLCASDQSYDLVALSVIFSWHAPFARELALAARDHADVWCGGPGIFALRKWWNDETGLVATSGLDERFEREPGDYKMVFASRGCPVGCSFCIVPRLEGTAFSLNWEFHPAPILCDNNLSALPVDFQEHIIDTYRAYGAKLLDANSGFEPGPFTRETYLRWKPILKGPWRFAFDEQREAKAVYDMMRVLGDESPRRKRVYTLAGNEEIRDCIDRAYAVIKWGGEPYAQYVRPLNWLGDQTALKHRFDWTEQLGSDFKRFFNRPAIWKSCDIWDYAPREHEAPPFARFKPTRSIVVGHATKKSPAVPPPTLDPQLFPLPEPPIGCSTVPVCVHGRSPGTCDSECDELGVDGFLFKTPAGATVANENGCAHYWLDNRDGTETCPHCDETRNVGPELRTVVTAAR